MFKVNFFLKVFISLIFAFLISRFFVSKIIFPYAPVVRPSFRKRVADLPINLKKVPEKLLTRNPNLPPPWKRKPLLPRKPPPFYPPTAVPKKKHRPPLIPTSTPKAIPTSKVSTPTPTSTYYQPSPTPPPTPTPTGFFYPPPSPTFSPGIPPSKVAAKLLDLINSEREKKGTYSLVFETHLNKAAQDYANIMTSCTHIGPDGSDPVQRMKKAGYPASFGGENIACNESSYTKAFQMWMAASDHKANMLDPAWKSAGIGYSRSYWVLDLGPI